MEQYIKKQLKGYLTNLVVVLVAIFLYKTNENISWSDPTFIKIILFFIGIFVFLPIFLQKITKGSWFQSKEEYEKIEKRKKIASEGMGKFQADVWKRAMKPLLIIFLIFIGAIIALYLMYTYTNIFPK